jgi:hypothetical protein
MSGVLSVDLLRAQDKFVSEDPIKREPCHQLILLKL